MFLAKQYTRCTACHYSPTGGGLLTPYGRLLSHRELSTTGGTADAPAAGAEDAPHGEQAFLYGALGRRARPRAPRDSRCVRPTCASGSPAVTRT